MERKLERIMSVMVGDSPLYRYRIFNANNHDEEMMLTIYIHQGQIYKNMSKPMEGVPKLDAFRPTADIVHNVVAGKLGCVYRHFKGNWYLVIDADEYESKDYIIYQALYGDDKIYYREYDEFMSKVDKKKYPKVKEPYRFMSRAEVAKFLKADDSEELFLKEVNK